MKGTAKILDCEGKRFLVEAEGSIVAFDMPDPSRVQLKHNGGDIIEFTCGPQKVFHVVVEYVAASAGSQSKGSLRTLEF
jgi:hypothetical protein